MAEFTIQAVAQFEPVPNAVRASPNKVSEIQIAVIGIDAGKVMKNEGGDYIRALTDRQLHLKVIGVVFSGRFRRTCFHEAFKVKCCPGRTDAQQP